MLCKLQCLGTLFRCFFYQVHVIIITLYGPINHIFMVGQFPISNHHLFRPQTVGFFRRQTQRVITGAGKHCGIISFRAGNRYIFPIIFQYGYISHILHDIIRFFRSHIFLCVATALHPNVVFHSTHLGNISQFGSINQYLCTDSLRFLILCQYFNNPFVLLFFHSLQKGVFPYAQVLFRSNHFMKNFIADRRLEKDMAYPARLERVYSSIIIG
ncbi:hypothetical protein IX307_001328 [Bacteroides pyogenes]|nr:hypothetical protein [Bacteroides pyogenes]MBR8787008.1 hypothetical protein [Bacteroides pyogenes]MBR8792547.1 hypothetical protein [Bacteroides pyogenes]